MSWLQQSLIIVLGEMELPSISQHDLASACSRLITIIWSDFVGLNRSAVKADEFRLLFIQIICKKGL